MWREGEAAVKVNMTTGAHGVDSTLPARLGQIHPWVV
jgi:hypothetical protein